MSSQKEQETSTRNSVVSKFYEGKSIFITGAGGFLGVVLLEILLRCCPGIHRIFILLRPKRGVQPEDRKELIFKKDIFRKLKEVNPDALNKVVVVPGDIAKENLGMCEEDTLKVTQEVSIVFHCAAVISFAKPLNFVIQQNVVGTFNIIELCRKLKKLEALVYTSTAYSNGYLKSVDEKVYGLSIKAEEVIELSKNGHEDQINRLFEKCKSYFPNSYTFSKSVAENLLSEIAADLPVAIVRPSIIICNLKGSMPGYIEYGSGIVSLSVGIGKGFIRVLRIDEDKCADIIPADVVANTHILAAYFQVLERLPSPFVYNCTSGEICKHTWGKFVHVLFDLAKKYPLPKAYQWPSLTLCKSSVKYWFFSVFEHYVPATVIDFLLWITGGQPRLLKLYKNYEKCTSSLIPFAFGEWQFKCENFKALSGKLNAADREQFLTELTDFSLKELSVCLIKGSPMYRKTDIMSEKERRRVTNLRYLLTSFIKWSVVGGMASAFYKTFF